MKNILITGGAGFIGTNLTDRLLSEGNSIVCLDNLYSGKLDNIQPFYKYGERFKFLPLDVRNAFNLSVPIDEIYHLACPASPVQYQKDDTFTLDTSIDGMRNMLELAKQKKAKLLFTSTSEIYGDAKEHPQNEKYWGNVNPIGDRSCYDEGKRVAESYCYAANKNGQDVRVVRIFNTYGPSMDVWDGRVVSNFINQALRNQDITIYGDGKQTRSFCYVSDMVEGLIRFMNFDKRYFGPINLGNPGEFTMRELSDKVLKLIPESKSKRVFKELPRDDPVNRKPDISRAYEMLGWEPKVQLDEGLVKTIEYFKRVKSKLQKL